MFEWQLTARLRTAITLIALAVLMLGGVSWGWAQMTKPFPGKVDAPVCVDTSYHAGDDLVVQDVTVNVYNASDRDGLATRTMQELTDAGFVAGRIGNAPKGTTLHAPAEIWVKDVDDPATKLVRPRVGKVPVVEHPESGDVGITLVVGNDFGDLRKGPDSVVLTSDAVVCSPPVE